MAASIPQYPSCFSSRSHSIKLVPSTLRSGKFKLPKCSSSSSEPEAEETDPVKLAFAKARAYKKAIQSNNPIPIITPNPVLESSQNGMESDNSASEFDDNGDIPVFADLLKQYSSDNNKVDKDSDPFAKGDFPKAEIIVGNCKFAEATTSKQSTLSEEDSGINKLKVSSEPVPVDDDPAKLAFAKARAYKEVAQSKNASFGISPDQVRESSESLRNTEGSVSEYNNNGDTPAFADLLKQMSKEGRDSVTDDTNGDTPAFADLLKQMSKEGRDSVTDDTISGADFPEVEIIVGDASKLGQATASEPNTMLKENSEQYRPKFASWSNPLSDTTYENESEFPEVEIIVGDASKFGRSKPRITLEEESGLYKPKVSLEPVTVDNDPVKLAFAKAREYKEVIQLNNPIPKISLDRVPESSENWMNKEESVSEYTNNADTLAFADLLKQMAKQSGDNNTDDTFSEVDFPEEEIIVGDASKFGQAVSSEPIKTLKEDSGRYEPKFTTWENSTSDTTLENEGEFPEVEIIVGDASKFARSKPRITLEEESGLYKTKVASETVPVDNDPVKLAYAKAREYKDVIQSDTNNGQAVASETNKTLQKDSGRYEPKVASWGNPSSTTTSENESEFPVVEIIVGDASKFVRSKPRITLEEESGLYKPKVSSETVPVNDPVKLQFAKSSAYKEVVQSNNPASKISPDQESSMNTENSVSEYTNNADTTTFADLLKQMAKQSGDINTDDTISELFPEGDFEVETGVGNISKFGQEIASEPNKTLKEDSGRYEPKVTSWGNPSSANTSENESGSPVWEIIVGDASKFGRSKPRITLEEESGLYKPKVSSERVPASAYKEVVQSRNPTSRISPDQESWMEIEKSVSEYTNNADTPAFADLLKQMAKQSGDNNTDDTISEPFPEGDFEVETSVRDASKFGQEVASEPNKALKEDLGRYEPKVTSWGIPSSSTTSENESGSPVWEIIVGDASKFGRSKPRITLEEESGLYKPKVSSERVPVDHHPAKLAYAKASAYKDVVQSRNPTSKISPDQESWMKIEKSVSEYTNNADTPAFADLLKQMAKLSGDNNTDDTISEPFQEENFPEVEIVVEDPNVKLAIAKARACIEVLQSKNPTPKISPDQFQQSSESRMNKEGLISEHTNNGDTPSFADLLNQMGKQRGAHNTDDTISEKAFSKVEINVGDPSKIGHTAAASEPNATLAEDSGQYKPNVTSLSSPPSTSDI